MSSSLVRRLVLLFAILVPAAAYAQEAVVSGTVTDLTGAVLPGVTLKAQHEESGNTFEAVTDARGAFRISLRIGTYRITGELQGFATVIRGGIEVLVGQTIDLSLQMKPGQVSETITVTADTPLVETTKSSLATSIDPRQVSQLPSQGRNWMGLALLAPGNRTNDSGATPVQDRVDVREFQLNVDGMQVTSNLGTGNQSRYSNDSIAEFQFISNRFDATQGRSSGVQVNAVTRSGTNMFSESLVGNFRNSALNAADPVLGVVVPYSDQQLSGTYGGPIIQNKLHFFANYEYERQPLTSIWQTSFPAFNIQLQGTRNVKLGGVRLDYQLSPKTRLMGKVSHSTLFQPFGPGGVNHPSATNTNEEHNTDVLGQFTQVLSNRALNEIRGGYAAYGLNQQSLTTWSNHWQAANGITSDGPVITFRGFRFNRNGNLPRYRDQGVYSIRDDFTFSFDAAGRHDLKMGGEYLRLLDNTRNCNTCGGNIDARGGSVPANIETLFPNAFNADTWNLAAISSITRTYTLGVSDSSAFLTPIHMWKYGAWAQDDWRISSRLTANLGLRYDLIWNAFAQNVTFLPFEAAGRPQDAKNIQPRLGFAYQINDRTVVRGGAGLYYADALNTNVLWPMSPLTIAVIQVTNDGRPDFAANPFNGPAPTYNQALLRFCDVKNAPGCLQRAPAELAPPPEFAHITHSWQGSIGIARQIGNDIAIEADYVYTGTRNEQQGGGGFSVDNINLSYNPVTGVNYPFDDASHKPFPDWGIVGVDTFNGWSNYHGLQTGFTKRMSHHWQGALTYTLSGLWTGDPLPLSGLTQITFPVQQDIGGQYSLGETDQRHRLVFNGIWQVAHGFQVSGIYFYGSGLRTQAFCGCDARGFGGAAGYDRLRQDDPLGPDGSIIPREGFVGQPIHRVDVRLQQRVPIGGGRSIGGFVEVFNVFNRKNYGLYDTTETDDTYGQPISSQSLTYAPRTLQLGFRMAF
jgi:carboxypeptidase family protein/TonB-dependent receptor-like protein